MKQMYGLGPFKEWVPPWGGLLYCTYAEIGRIPKGERNMAQPDSEGAKEEAREIPSEIERNAKALEGLHTSIGVLERRLTAVLKDEKAEKAPGVSASPTQAPHVSLLLDIERSTDRIMRADSRVADLIVRLMI